MARRLAEMEAQIDARLAQPRRVAGHADPNIESTLAAWIARANRLHAPATTGPRRGLRARSSFARFPYKTRELHKRLTAYLRRVDAEVLHGFDGFYEYMRAKIKAVRRFCQ